MEEQGVSTAIERVERALLLLAWFIEQDGDVHLPMYERFETELVASKRANGIRDRARQRLESYLQPGGLKAIR